MFGLHWTYIVILLVVVLIIFGPGRLPELGGAVGKAMREFRKATTELTNEVTTAVQAQPAPAAPAPPTPPPAPVVTSESAAKGSTSEANPPQS
jgi:sec-independent protein translocase protein TatA